MVCTYILPYFVKFIYCPTHIYLTIPVPVNHRISYENCTRHKQLTSVSQLEMPLKAVFFDLDDTLVPTSEIDMYAYAAVGDLASSLAPGVDVNKLLEDFKEKCKLKPWDPEHVVDVTEWRASLWVESLQLQAISNATSLGPMFQVRESGR